MALRPSILEQIGQEGIGADLRSQIAALMDERKGWKNPQWESQPMSAEQWNYMLDNGLLTDEIRQEQESLWKALQAEKDAHWEGRQDWKRQAAERQRQIENQMAGRISQLRQADKEWWENRRAERSV